MTDPHNSTPPTSTGPLAGLTVLDLSRVLAGPWCAQILGDLGAEVIKVEQPGMGDDTRKWGPPFLPDGSGDASYYACANRNKRSIAVNIATPEGADVIRGIAAKADIVIENFRPGGLAKYGLDYSDLRAIKPDLIWCSITGFGHSGPEKDRGGYDFLIQGMSGLMSVTGAPDGPPTKAGVPIADLLTGLWAAISVLGALHHRTQTGEGQQIDLAMLDGTIAMLGNHWASALNAGAEPERMGNQHTTIVPYQDFACADGNVLVASANDQQFRRLCGILGLDELADDPRFAEIKGRAVNRAALMEYLEPAIAKWQSDDFVEAMHAAKVPGGKVNSIPQALALPQVAARELVKSLSRSNGGTVKVVGFPGQLSETPADYRRAPPLAGENTREVLREVLGMDDAKIAGLEQTGAIETR
ncbi:CaiB/BaiF CoA-transferase family protein [Tsuneonella suprasediminis]|uniref:CaiB/BaiF CoA transferase family protein n=1 Tax=Tsuneonella suprasediminis TaxID=2306996 RepID=UPI002F939B1A